MLKLLRTLTYIGSLWIASMLALAADQPDKPQRIENKQYHFAFTFESGTELEYEENGVGFSGSHVPTGEKRSDYGVLVYGSPAMQLTSAEAKAAKLGDKA